MDKDTCPHPCSNG